jgi:hypothetical protein
MGEKLSPGGLTGYMIIKRIPSATYNYWKAASDNGISGAAGSIRLSFNNLGGKI